ncbi:MAG: aldo/keto reductase [Patescibacteria group bacterium]|jgi:diketogulonate reductase-like aldo/keto reductase
MKTLPRLGLGTWKSEPGKVGAAVTHAITNCGYRHIDSAAIYGNEKEIGEALSKLFTTKTITREELFVTSKLWNNMHKKERVRMACEKTLKDLQLDYLDLYLMHWGVAMPESGQSFDEEGLLVTEKTSIRETWEAMEELVDAGLVRSIGVANFTAPMLLDLLSYARVLPAMNQIELHPYIQQPELVQFCTERGIQVTAYSPLGSRGNTEKRGLPSPLDDATIISLAKQHNKTPAQIALRWAIQRKTIPIPKSVTPKRIKENYDVYDFELSESDMQAIRQIDKNMRFIDPSLWWKIPYFN